MIGNDIVDIARAEVESNIFRPRFLDKICSADEKEWILSSHNAIRDFWRIWTMKESAYKAFQRKLEKKPLFNPFAFLCELDSPTTGRVVYQDHQVVTSTFQKQEYIYSEVTPSSPTRTFFGSTSDFLMKIKSEFELKALPTLIKSEIGLPALSLTTKTLPISKTHHGDFQAFQY